MILDHEQGGNYIFERKEKDEKSCSILNDTFGSIDIFVIKISTIAIFLSQPILDLTLIIF